MMYFHLHMLVANNTLSMHCMFRISISLEDINEVGNILVETWYHRFMLL